MTAKVQTYEEIDRTEWEKLVRESRTGTWFQSPEAYDFYASLPELMEPFVYAISSQQSVISSQESGNSNRLSVISSQESEISSQLSAFSHQKIEINEQNQECGLRAVCVGYVTKERSTVKQFFTRRAIIIGGPVFANDATLEEVETLMMAVRNQFKILDFKFKILNAPIYIETRNFNDYSCWKEAFEAAGFAYKKHLNFHVDCRDKEKICERLSDNRKRQIRHAKQNGATITKLSNDENDIREWYEILRELYRTRVKTPLFTLKFFIKAHRQGIGKFLLVKHEGKVIGGSMVVMSEGNNELKSERINELKNGGMSEGTVYEWFECGLNAEYKELYPSVMATYAGIEFASENGYARYDMMGAGEPGVPYGVRDFKAEFGGELVEHGRFLCVCKPLLYQLGTVGVRILRKS